MLEVYPTQYHRKDTKENTALSNVFGFASVTSLKRFLPHQIIKTDIRKGEIVMILLRLLMKVLLLPIMLVLFVLRMLVKIGIELSPIVLGCMMLIVFGCIINAIIRKMWPSAGILMVMEACLVMICTAAGVLVFFLEEATTSLGRIIRS